MTTRTKCTDDDVVQNSSASSGLAGVAWRNWPRTRHACQGASQNVRSPLTTTTRQPRCRLPTARPDEATPSTAYWLTRPAPSTPRRRSDSLVSSFVRNRRLKSTSTTRRAQRRSLRRAADGRKFISRNDVRSYCHRDEVRRTPRVRAREAPPSGLMLRESIPSTLVKGSADVFAGVLRCDEQRRETFVLRRAVIGARSK